MVTVSGQGKNWKRKLFPSFLKFLTTDFHPTIWAVLIKKSERRKIIGLSLTGLLAFGWLETPEPEFHVIPDKNYFFTTLH